MRKQIWLVALIGLFMACSKSDYSDKKAVSDLGIIDSPLYETDGILEFGNTDGASQEILFTIDTYSEFSITLTGITGSFYLESITDGPITHNGAIKDPSNKLPISRNLQYSTELFEGEYRIIIEGKLHYEVVEAGSAAAYHMIIRAIDDQEPYEDLGVISIPYNSILEPIGESPTTVYEFEILEGTHASVIVTAAVCSDPDYVAELRNAEGGTIPGKLNVQLAKGRYSLLMDTSLTLILNDPEAGDIDFGVITDYPQNLEVTIDMQYEPDSKQRCYFEILEEVSLEGFEFVTPDMMTFLYKESGESITTAAATVLQPGRYYILNEIDGLAWGNCDQEYRVVTGSHTYVVSLN